jgi:hypothetical protein
MDAPVTDHTIVALEVIEIDFSALRVVDHIVGGAADDTNLGATAFVPSRDHTVAASM